MGKQLIKVQAIEKHFIALPKDGFHVVATVSFV